MSKRLTREPGQLDIVKLVTGRPSKKHAGVDIRLCGRCNAIKLEAFLDDVLDGKHQPTEQHGIDVCELGRINNWSRSCSLCRIFRYAAEQEKVYWPGLLVLRLVSRRLSD